MADQPGAVERTRDDGMTPLQRFVRDAGDFLASLGRLFVLSLFLGVILFSGLMSLDLPIHWFDHWFAAGAQQPSQWLTWGGLYFWLAAMAVVLMARRFGGEEAGRAVTAAWTLAAVGVFAGLSYLAPQLENSDLPRLRAVIGIVASAMAGQFVVAAAYDIMRGGARWWRAPFFALLVGALVHVIIYFPVIYAGFRFPWINWMVADFAFKAVASALFLVPYAMLRDPLRPRGGLGG